MGISSVSGWIRTRKRSSGRTAKNSTQVFCIRWAVLRLRHRKRMGIVAIRRKILIIFPLSATGIGSCKANSAPSFFYISAQEQPNLIQWFACCFSRPSTASFSLFPKSVPEDINTMIGRAFTSALIRLITCIGKNRCKHYKYSYICFYILSLRKRDA